MAEKIKLGSNGNFGVKEGGTLAYNDEDGVFKAIELASSRSSGATYVNQSGIIADAEVGVPRIDWTNGVGELLLEPQSTNLYTYSEELDNPAWLKLGIGSGVAPVVTADYALSPDGSSNADRVQFDTIGSTGGDYSNIYDGFSLDGSSQYTISFYVKSNTGSTQQLNFLTNSSNTGLVNVTTEWTRVSYTFTSNTTTARNFGLSARGTIQPQVDILIWGAQLEQLSYPTSLIRTSGSSVTRIADAVTGNSSLGQVINSSEGVLYFEGSFLTDEYSSFAGIYLRDLASLNDSVQIRTDIGNPNALQFYMFDGGVQQVGTTYVASDITQNFKVAFKYELNNVKVYFNGSEIVSDTNATMPSGLNKLQFISNGFRTREVKVYDTALTNAELTTLTTL